MSKTSKAAPEKKEAVEKVKKLISSYPIIGIVNLSTLPAANYARMRMKFRGKAEFAMTRKTLMVKALKDSGLKNVEQIIEKLEGVPALLFTKENPFSIYKTIKAAKQPAPAKAGDISPRDITIPKGPTPFGPGPVISEFAQLGVQAGVEEGKVAVKKDTVVIREGETFSGPLAGMLSKLGILPMEVGLDLPAIYEDGILYGRKVLDIDEEQFAADLQTAISEGFNLSVEICFITADNVETLLQKASREARALGLEGGIMAPELVEDVLAKGQREAKSVADAAQFDIQ